MSGHGNTDRKKSLIGEFAASERSRAPFPLIHRIVKGQSALASLGFMSDILRETSRGGAASIQVSDISNLVTLERNLSQPKLSGVLDDPLLANMQSDGLVTAIIQAAQSDQRHERTRHGSGSSATQVDGDDKLMAALRSAKYFVFREQLRALLDENSGDYELILELLTNAPVLEIRRAALACNLSSLASRDDVLARAAELATFDNFRRVISLKLLTNHLNLGSIADLKSDDKVFRLEEGVVRKMLSYKLSKINWVREVSAPVVDFAMRPNHSPPILEPYLDSASLEVLVGMLGVISRFLGLQTKPPDNAGGFFSLPMIFSELRMLVYPRQKRDDATALDERKIAHGYIRMALDDAERYLTTVMSSTNPDGHIPCSILPADAPSIGELQQARTMSEESLKSQRRYPTQAYQLKLLTEDLAMRTAGKSKRPPEVLDRRVSTRPDAAQEHDYDAVQVKDTPNGDGFCYCDRDGKPMSLTYAYSKIEAKAGRSRDDLDFAVVLSNRTTAEGRLSKCRFHGLPGHESADSSAHVAPSGFVEAVKLRPQDFELAPALGFAMPAGRGAPSPARNNSPGRSSPHSSPHH